MLNLLKKNAKNRWKLNAVCAEILFIFIPVCTTLYQFIPLYKILNNFLLLFSAINTDQIY